MKRLLFLLLVLMILSSCFEERDPNRFHGCVVIEKYTLPNRLELKLSEQFRDSLGRDYLRITVPYYEMGKFNVGDTIQ